MTDDEFEELWKTLVSRVHTEGSKPLTKPERLFCAVNLLRGAVPRSGFIGYFESETGADIGNAFEGLKEIRLPAVLALLEEAKAIAFGDTPIPPDAQPVPVFPESLTEDELDEASDRLDEALQPVQEKFYDCEEDLWQALLRYADEQGLRAGG